MGRLKTRVFRLSNICLLLNANRKAFKSKNFLILPNLGYGDLDASVLPDIPAGPITYSVMANAARIVREVLS